MSKFIKLLIKIIVTGTCLFFISKNVDLDTLLEKGNQLSIKTILFSVGIFLSHVLAVAIRWQYFVRKLGCDIDFWNAIRLVAMGTFLNQVLFGTVAGDGIRIFYLKKKKASNSCAYGSVVLDRYTAILVIWIFVIISLLFFDIPLSEDQIVSAGIYVFSFGGATLLGLSFLPLFSFLPRWKYLNFLQRPFQFLFSLSRAFNSLFMSASNLLTVLVPSLYVAFSSSIVIWLLANDINADLSLANCLFVTPIALLVSAIPVTIGGWGLRELSLISLLGLMSISADTAVFISISFGLLILISGVINGVYSVIRS